jgi:hypothetical protein
VATAVEHDALSEKFATHLSDRPSTSPFWNGECGEVANPGFLFRRVQRISCTEGAKIPAPLELEVGLEGF